MAILYYVGIAIVGWAVMGSIVGFVAGGRLSAMVNLLIAVVCCIEPHGGRESWLT